MKHVRLLKLITIFVALNFCVGSVYLKADTYFEGIIANQKKHIADSNKQLADLKLETIADQCFTYKTRAILSVLGVEFIVGIAAYFLIKAKHKKLTKQEIKSDFKVFLALVTPWKEKSRKKICENKKLILFVAALGVAMVGSAVGIHFYGNNAAKKLKDEKNKINVKKNKATAVLEHLKKRLVVLAPEIKKFKDGNIDVDSELLAESFALGLIDKNDSKTQKLLTKILHLQIRQNDVESVSKFAPFINKLDVNILIKILGGDCLDFPGIQVDEKHLKKMTMDKEKIEMIVTLLDAGASIPMDSGNFSMRKLLDDAAKSNSFDNGIKTQLSAHLAKNKE